MNVIICKLCHVDLQNCFQIIFAMDFVASGPFVIFCIVLPHYYHEKNLLHWIMFDIDTYQQSQLINVKI